MSKLKIYLCIPTEGKTNIQLSDDINAETIRLDDMFSEYEHEIVIQLNPDKRIETLTNCDVCALADGWQYVNRCRLEQKFAVSIGKPIVNTDAEYTKKFIRDYIISKCKNYLQNIPYNEKEDI